MNGYEFIIVQDFYTEDINEEGNAELRLVKPNLNTKWYCRDLSMISDFGQVFNKNGNIRVHHSAITVNGEERIIKLPYSKTKNLLSTSRPIKAGFNLKNK